MFTEYRVMITNRTPDGKVVIECIATFKNKEQAQATIKEMAKENKSTWIQERI
jgi:hypothetical protein